MRKLAAFVVASLALHLLLMTRAAWRLPETAAPDSMPPITARLMPPPAAPTRAPKPARHEQTAAVPVIAAANEDAAPAVLQVPAAQDGATGTAPPQAPPAPPAPVNTAPPATHTLSGHGRIDYTLFYGKDEYDDRPVGNPRDNRGSRDNLFPVGHAEQEWTVADGRYHLTMLAEPSGLAALFVKQRYAFESSGRVTPQGLQPELLVADRTRRGESHHGRARMDWGAMTVSLESPPQQSPLRPGAQDVLSFMFQLGLMPLAPGRVRMDVITGWKVESYDLDIGEAQTIRTPMGALTAIPVRQARLPDHESIEVWLAPGYRMLPVRIRYYDRDGKPSVEQLARSIDLPPTETP